MKLTNEKRQALIERCKKHLEWHEKLGFRGEVEEELASIHRIALAALTADPVKVPDEMPETWVWKADGYFDVSECWNDCRAEVLRMNASQNGKPGDSGNDDI